MWTVRVDSDHASNSEPLLGILNLPGFFECISVTEEFALHAVFLCLSPLHQWLCGDSERVHCASLLQVDALKENQLLVAH